MTFREYQMNYFDKLANPSPIKKVDVKSLQSKVYELTEMVERLSGNIKKIKLENRELKKLISRYKINLDAPLLEIAIIVSNYTGVSVKAMKNKTRYRENVRARCLFYLICKDRGYTYGQMSKFLNREHSSVVLSMKNYQKQIFDNDIDFVNQNK